jgi:cytochrome c-type biogenesis protein CcmH/NrfG
MEMKRTLQAMGVLVTVLVLGACATTGGTAPARDMDALVKVEQQADDAYKNGSSEEAAQLYRTMVEAMPDEAEYWYRLANSLVRTGRYDDAVIAYRQALSRDPENARAWHNLGIVRLRQAQASFAMSVQNSQSGDRVFEESLKLSTSVFSLTGPGADPPAQQGTESEVGQEVSKQLEVPTAPAGK